MKKPIDWELTLPARLGFAFYLLLPMTLVQAESWPGLRGVHGDSHSVETGVTGDFAKHPPRVVWAIELGQGYSSFAIVDKKVYTQYQPALGQYVIALSFDTGETLWETRYDLPFDPLGIYPGPRSTPAVADGRLFFVSPDVLLGCLDAETGNRLWSVDLKRKFRPTGADFGYSASPLVLEDRVILPLGGDGTGVTAFDVADGSVVWSSLDAAASYCTMFPIELDGKRLLVAYLENVAAILDASDGRLLWRDELSTGYDEHSAAPLYREPYLVFAAPFRAGATAYRLSWSENGDLAVEYEWFQKKFSNDVSSSVVVGDAIYGFDLRDMQSKAHRPSRGELRCLDIETGEILWSTDRVAQCSLVAVDGRLLMWTDKGELVVAEINREKYIEQARLELFPDEICWTSPAFADGKLFVRTQSRAACIDLRPPADGAPAAVPTKFRIVSRRRDWQWLLGAEREHPFMRPMLEEYFDWFAASLAVVFLPATVIAFVVASVTKVGVHSQFRLWCVSSAMLGIVATPLLNRLGLREFLFTWPVTLIAMLQWAMLENATFNRHVDLTHWQRLRKNLVVRLIDIAFVLICVGYFIALHRLSLPHEWVFLIGFVAAFPFCWKGAQASHRSHYVVTAIIWCLAGFSAGFWSSVLFPTLRGIVFTPA